MTHKNNIWYYNKTLVIILCIFLFPLGLYGLWKSNNFSKNGKIGGTVAISILLITAIVVPNNSNKNEITMGNLENNENVKGEDKEVELSNDESVKLAKMLNIEIESINEGIDFSIFREPVENIELAISIFKAWGDYIRKGENSKDPDIKKLAIELKKKTTDIQSKEFPIFRKFYSEKLSNSLGEQDIEVKVSGSRYSNLTFIGGLFIENKNKIEFHKKSQEMFELLRFKRINYFTNENETDHTYYDVFKGEDTDILNK